MCPRCGQPMGPIRSPKNINTLILLIFIFGGLGIHRFYVGKVKTGLLMLFILGGLGIWTAIDFCIATSGQFKDSNGHYIKGNCLRATIWIILTIIVCIIGAISARR
jgi:TM2 domain-containing membrane protein YozV